ncbi:prenylated flavin chaperone LpdD [Desulforudis sp. DRI-14]|uniref:prenylated flavin chaperone LpdD n=1 Tax=Desulforudis sp. DRI-14 TaxID=3459793 RepID=UPI003BCC6758
MQQLSFRAGEGRHRVELTASLTGDGLVVTIAGGERPHIGAVCVGLPRPSMDDPARLSCNVAVLPVVGHKDDEIARPVAENLARHTGQVSVVAAGLHVDAASDRDIALLIANAWQVVDKLLEALGKKG